MKIKLLNPLALTSQTCTNRFFLLVEGRRNMGPFSRYNIGRKLSSRKKGKNKKAEKNCCHEVFEQ